MTGPLAERAPGLFKTLREHDPDFVLLDGTLAECDRVGDCWADYSAKHRRHGVNVRVLTDPAGELLWISPALPGRTHDLSAARTHRMIRICERGMARRKSWQIFRRSRISPNRRTVTTKTVLTLEGQR